MLLTQRATQKVINFGTIDLDDKGAVAASLGDSEYELAFGKTVTEAEGKFISTLLEVNPNLTGIDLERDEISNDADAAGDSSVDAAVALTETGLVNTTSLFNNSPFATNLRTTELLETGTARLTGSVTMTGLEAATTFGMSSSSGKKSEVPEAIAHIIIAFLLHDTWHELDMRNFR